MAYTEFQRELEALGRPRYTVGSVNEHQEEVAAITERFSQALAGEYLRPEIAEDEVIAQAVFAKANAYSAPFMVFSDVEEGYEKYADIANTVYERLAAKTAENVK